MKILGISVGRTAPPAATTSPAALAVSADNASLRQRMAAIASGGYDQADTLHNVYLDYGYPLNLTFHNYWNMYRRFGIAKAVVETVTDTGWITPPTVEAPEAFTNALADLADRTKLWHRLKGLDNRQRVGRYAGLFMRVRDGKQPSEPLEGTLPGAGALVGITPLYESQLEVSETDSDPQSETFGLPSMYEFRSGVEGDRDVNTQSNFKIHPSRLVIAAEGADSDSIFGVSALEAGYNSLMDLRKIVGAGGEGFYKNAAQSIAFELQDATSATQNATLLAKFNENFDEFMRNRFRRSMWTPGLTPHVLQSNLTDPKEFFNNALNDVAASVPIPATVLIGQQTGRLASAEDTQTFRASVQSRRHNFMTDLVNSVLDWFIAAGVLPDAEYTVEWDDLLAMSDAVRVGNVKSMATANREQFLSGGLPVYTVEEMRDAGGLDPQEPIPEPNEDEVLDDEE